MSAVDLALAAVTADDLHGPGTAALLDDAAAAEVVLAGMDPVDIAYLREHGVDPMALAAWVRTAASRRLDAMDAAPSGPVERTARPRYFVDEHGYLRQS